MVKDVLGNGGQLTLIAGPCVIENEDLVFEVASRISAIAEELQIDYYFKASFDKANRTSAKHFRGPGLEKGLNILKKVKEYAGVKVVTDIHEPWQAQIVGEVVDIIQIPAFLCRQTDLLEAAARTGKILNIKKAQFMSPEEMAKVVSKVEHFGNNKMLLCDRGTCFGYHNQVVDMTSIPRMQKLGYPVVIDATHSVQISGGGADNTNSGAREYVPYIARAGMAAGADILFMEVHPEPEKGLCDASCMWKLSELKPLLSQCKKIYEIVKL
nr:3-deoxy-8-phosphooctulonate synthase [uncultured Acetatifactor sp.]